MLLQITHREQRQIEIFCLKGPLTFGDPDLAFQSVIEQAIASGKIRLVIDLSGVSWMDCTGRATLLATDERLRALGGGLALVHLRSVPMDPTEVGKLERFFEPFELEQEAVNSFFPDLRVRRLDLLETIKSYRRSAHTPERQRLPVR